MGFKNKGNQEISTGYLAKRAVNGVCGTTSDLECATRVLYGISFPTYILTIVNVSNLNITPNNTVTMDIEFYFNGNYTLPIGPTGYAIVPFSLQDALGNPLGYSKPSIQLQSNVVTENNTYTVSNVTFALYSSVAQGDTIYIGSNSFGYETANSNNLYAINI